MSLRRGTRANAARCLRIVYIYDSHYQRFFRDFRHFSPICRESIRQRCIGCDEISRGRRRGCTQSVCAKRPGTRQPRSRKIRSQRGRGKGGCRLQEGGRTMPVNGQRITFLSAIPIARDNIQFLIKTYLIEATSRLLRKTDSIRASGHCLGTRPLVRSRRVWAVGTGKRRRGGGRI